MPWSIFNETMRRNWRGMIYWGCGLALLGFLILFIIPNLDFLKQFENFLNTMPGIIKALGMEDAAQMATPEGFVSAGYFGRVLLILAVYTVLAGLNVTVNEEDAGIMDVLLSLPVPRWRIVLEKFAAYALMLTGIVLFGFVGLLVGGISSAIQLDVQLLIISNLNILPSALLMLAFTMFVGTLFRRKSLATAVAAFFIVGSYILDLIGSLASESPIAVLRSISFFSYYDNAHVMQTGLNAGSVVLLLGITIALVIASVWAFQRRDVGI